MSKRIYSTDLENITTEELEKLRIQYMRDPMSLLDVDKDDAEHIKKQVAGFLRSYEGDLIAKGYPMGGYVIGLSGGIDSSLTAYLAVEAVGRERVYGMLLPSKFTTEEDISDAMLVVNNLGIEHNDYEKVRKEFGDAVAATMRMTGVDENHPKYKIILGNNHARERMKILRGAAYARNAIVLGTTNYSENMLGYATVAGDGYKGVDIEPIQKLPKTSERKFAKLIGMPDRLVNKVPTAGLWQGQTDEDELGVTYETIDRVLTGMELGLSNQEIIKANNKPEVSEKSIKLVKWWVEKNRFKGEPEPYADLTGRISYERDYDKNK